MTIKLYNNTSERNKIVKTLSLVETLTGSVRDKTDIINPVIMIERTNPTGFNYAEITEFGRYYFVNDVTVERTGLIVLSLSIDVLKSYATSIKSQKIIVDKSTTDYNNYLPDENLKTNVKTKTDILNFSGGFLESGEFILITAGG